MHGHPRSYLMFGMIACCIALGCCNFGYVMDNAIPPSLRDAHRTIPQKHVRMDAYQSRYRRRRVFRTPRDQRFEPEMFD